LHKRQVHTHYIHTHIHSSATRDRQACTIPPEPQAHSLNLLKTREEGGQKVILMSGLKAMSKHNQGKRSTGIKNPALSCSKHPLPGIGEALCVASTISPSTFIQFVKSNYRNIQMEPSTQDAAASPPMTCNVFHCHSTYPYHCLSITRPTTSHPTSPAPLPLTHTHELEEAVFCQKEHPHVPLKFFWFKKKKVKRSSENWSYRVGGPVSHSHTKDHE
jgi:hypothetical protein